MKSKTHTAVGILGLAALGALAWSSSAALASDPANGVFAASHASVVGAGGAGGAGTPERRSRSVAPDFARLLAEQAPGAELTLNVFDDYAPVGRVERFERQDQYWVVSGELVGEAESSFLFVIGETTVTGEVRSPKHGTYEVRRTRGVAHVLRQVDDHGFKPCAAGHEHEASGGGHDDEHGVNTPRGDAPEIRVAVFYTPLAREDEGGEEAIRGRAVFAINQANAAYTSSAAMARLSLAHAGVVEYTESNSSSTDIARLRNSADGYMDIVHCVRDIVRADLVALLVNNFDACGIGYIQTNPGPGFEAFGFTVTDKDCISNFSFAHEIGHNMGCAHDRDNAGNAAYPYAYGYRTPDSEYRTIMAYAPGTRIQRFSNPDVMYLGYALGSPLDGPNGTSNALCITLTAGWLSGFRAGEGRYADFNADGVVTSQDFFDFLPAFFGSTAASDFNADGVRNSQDFFDFITAFFQAC